MANIVSLLIGDRHFIERNMAVRILLHLLFCLILLTALAASVVDQCDEQPYIPLAIAAVFYLFIYRYLLRISMVAMVLCLVIQWPLAVLLSNFIGDLLAISNRMLLLSMLHVFFIEVCYWLRKKYDE